MRELTAEEMMAVDGEGFWSGVGCGLALAGAVFAAVSPEPFSKIALVTYGGTIIGCVTAF